MESEPAEVSPEVRALLKARANGEFPGGEVPLPPEMLENRRLWREYASRLEGKALVTARPERGRRFRRVSLSLIQVVGSTITATLIFSILSTLENQRAELAEYKDREQENIRKLNSTTDALERRIAIAEDSNRVLTEKTKRLLDQLAAFEDSNQSLTEKIKLLSQQLAVRPPDRKSAWPPEYLLLTESMPTTPRPANAIGEWRPSFAVWLHQVDTRIYNGTVLFPFNPGSRPLPIEAWIDEDNMTWNIKLKSNLLPNRDDVDFDRSLSTWAGKYLGVRAKISDIPTYDLLIDKNTNTFKGKFMNNNVNGKLIY